MSARLSPNTWTLILPSGKNQVQVRLEPSPGCPSSLKIFNRYSCVYSDLYSILCLSPPTHALIRVCIFVYILIYLYIYMYIYTIYVHYLYCVLLFRSLSPRRVLWLFYLLKNNRVCAGMLTRFSPGATAWVFVLHVWGKGGRASDALTVS